MKLRIAAAAAVGVVLIGILAWPLAEPSKPQGAVCVNELSLSAAAMLVFLAVLTGLIAYFVSWPHGREIGILAVPLGLAVWAVRSSSMAGLMQLNPAPEHRQALLASFKWEPLFWLAIVAAGFAGALLGEKIRTAPKATQAKEKPKSKSNMYLNTAIALAASVLIAQFFIGILAQDVKMLDNRLGSVVGQPAIGQVVFAVLVSFGLAAFVIKHFLNAGYIWGIIASAFVTAFAIITYVKESVLLHLAQDWPAVFFSNAVISILPVQMVAFGTLGSIAGYWMAIRYDYWRKHEI